MKSPIVPLEVQHHIISLAGTRRDVMDCALVCRDWLTGSRTITFSAPVSCISSADMRNGKIILVSLLQHPHSTLSSFMTRVRLVLDRSHGEEGVAALDYDGIFRTIITHVKIIKEIDVSHSVFPLPDSQILNVIPNLIEFIRAYLSTIQILTLGGKFGPQDLQPLMQTLSGATVLTDLTVALLSGEKVLDTPLPAAPGSLRRLTTNCMDPALLETWGSAASQIVFQVENWTNMHNFRSNLSFLQKKAEETGVPRAWNIDLNTSLQLPEVEYNPLMVFLHDPHLSSHVTTIGLGLYSKSNEFPPLFDLSHFTKLSLLMVTISFSWDEILLPPIISIFRSLATLPAASRPGLQLDFRISYDSRPSAEFLHELDQAMDAYLKDMFEVRHINIRVQSYLRINPGPSLDLRLCVARERLMPNLTLVI